MRVVAAGQPQPDSAAEEEKKRKKVGSEGKKVLIASQPR